jgi:hypothetical protein
MINCVQVLDRFQLRRYTKDTLGDNEVKAFAAGLAKLLNVWRLSLAPG